MRRFPFAVAAAGLLSLAVIAPASAAVVPHISLIQDNLTLESTLRKTTINTPSGLEPAITGQLLFTVHGQPLAGSIDMVIQEKTGSGWIDTISAPRVNFPLDPPVRGFAMYPGDYLCSGTNNYWRIAFSIHAESSDGVWQGPVTYFFTNGNGTVNEPGGLRINCG